MAGKEIEYFRITKDWQLITGDHPDTVKSDATLYWVTVAETEKSLDVRFMDNNLNETTFKKNSFIISGINLNYDRKKYGSWSVKFRDAQDRGRIEYFWSFDGTVNRLKELDELGSWKALDLKVENDDLSKRVETRDEWLKDSEKQLEELKEKNN